MNFDHLRLRNDRAYRTELTLKVATDEALRQEMRHTAKTNLLALCYILGYTKVDPIIHREALDFFIPRDISKPVSEQSSGQPTRGTLLYPRGTYKTTIDEADSVQECICFPEDGILFFVCANQKLADALVSNVGAHFIKPKTAPATLFQSLFPELCVSDWRAADGGAFSTAIRQTDPPIKESLVMGFSVEAGVSGWHCWRFKGDDIANNRNMESQSSQDKVFRNYQTNRKMLNPGGIEDKLGTRYGPFDPYGRELTSSRPGSYRYVNKPALRLKSGERLDSNGFPGRDDVELLFEPLGLTYEMLRGEYEVDFDSFMTQYMNDAFGSNEVTFSHELLMGATRPDAEMPLDADVEIRWRLPNKTAGWRFACGLVGYSDGLRMHVVDGIHGAYKPSVLAIKIAMLARKHDVHRITIEDSPGARNVEPAILNYALTMGYHLRIHWAEHRADESERDLRIKGLEPFMVATRLVIADSLPIMKKLLEQFSNYGIVGENAIPDIISRLCERLPESIGVRSGETLEDGLAREQMLHRDHWNMIHGAGMYAEREVAPEPGEPEWIDDEPEGHPLGLDDIMPGLNA